MSQEDKLEVVEKKTYNRTLQQEWTQYFEAKGELEMVYKELLEKSLRAKANKQDIDGMVIKKEGTQPDRKGIENLFHARGWDFIYKPTPDHKSMKERLITNKIPVPFIIIAPCAYIKSNKKEEESEE
jgi:hypothetical protein